MKMLLCADVQLGAACAENLGVNLSHKWQAARMEKLTDLIDRTAQNNAGYLALFGRMFGPGRILESTIDRLFQAAIEEKEIQILAFTMADEYQRISYRNDIPENFHLLCVQAEDAFQDQNIAVRIHNGGIELQLADNAPVRVQKNAEKRFMLSGAGENQIVPSFEPVGFEDAQETQFGYSVLEWNDETLVGCRRIENQKYAFRSVEARLCPVDEPNDILQKIRTATANLSADTFLRITMTGQSAFGVTLNSKALQRQLQNRIFFAEVYDNTVMDIDEEAFENDISLRSEFVRLALRDDSLSESERSRLISFGWNALNGREVSAE